MKKKSITKQGFNFIHAIKENEIAPSSNLQVDAKADANTLELSFSEDIGTPNELYLVAYDKKSSSCLAYQKVFQKTDKNIQCSFSEEFLAFFKIFPNCKYARLCIALLYDKDYIYYFLKSSSINTSVERNCYVGTLKTFLWDNTEQSMIVYYSNGNQLSIKYMETSECYKKYINCILEKITYKEKFLTLTLNCYCLPDTTPLLSWISKTTGDTADIFVSNIKSRNKISSTREIIEFTCELNIEDIISSDAFRLIYRLGNYDINIIFDEENTNLLSDELFSSIIKPENSNIELAFSCDNENMLDLQIGEHIYPYMFSIIMAVYNTEPFLAEALDSILEQDLSSLQEYLVGNNCSDYSKRLFRCPYELIMVDDGATDSSGSICDEYAKENNNFVAIHKENGGVSSARNAGIKIATGKYLNFMDSDDRFSNNVLSECFIYFEKHYEETNIVTIPIKFFDAATGDHWLNEKFKDGNRIINLLNEHDKSLLFVNASMFKAECIKNKIWFEESLRTGEDIRFIYSNFFQNEPQFGVIDNCTYWYRRRSVGEVSAIQESNKTKNYYYEYLSDCLEWLLAEAKRTYNFVPHYIQYLIAQQLQWRFVTDRYAEMAKEVLNDEEFKEYKIHIAEILQNINSSIILEQKRLFTEHRKYILEMKYDSKAISYFDGKDILYYLDGYLLSSASSFVRLEFLQISDNTLYIEGYNRTYETDSEFYIKVNDQSYPVEFTDYDRNSYSLGEVIYIGQSFTVKVELNDAVSLYTLGFFEKINGHEILKDRVLYHKFMPLTKKYYKSYYTKDGWGIRLEQGIFKINNLMYSTAIKIYETYENEFVNQVIKQTPSIEKKEVANALEIRKEVIKTKALINQYKGKRIWLISDRTNIAGDNGEALFRFLAEKNDPNIEFYFVINEESPDYKRLKKIGNVVAQNSREHKVLHLLAEYIISSQAEDYVFNPFWEECTDDLYKDLLSIPQFIFLQHGITKDDLSNWLNRFNKNISGFITAAYPEQQSIINYDYFYSPEKIWLTGFPRHDRLYHDEKKYITIMPTWRSYLVTDSGKLAEKVVADNFQYSDFFKFYNNLLNDERLLCAARKNGYTICFMPHPHLASAVEFFDQNPEVLFWNCKKAYNELFAESNLVVTDYSSTVMDFAYLRKPVIYCQFDNEEFFSGKHTYEKGYYEYERDGFGEVTYDLDSLVDTIIDYIEKGCLLKPKYEERINNFFAYNDKNNCKRVYQKLLENC